MTIEEQPSDYKKLQGQDASCSEVASRVRRRLFGSNGLAWDWDPLVRGLAREFINPF